MVSKDLIFRPISNYYADAHRLDVAHRRPAAQPAGRAVFVTGASGYLGRHLIPVLAERGHRVTALVRPGSPHPRAATEVVRGDVFAPESYRGRIAPGATLVHLVGTPRPNPFKADAFQAVDLASVRAMLAAARAARVAHIVYVSVAQPAPVMRAFVAVRAEAERLIRASGIPATFLRPWYVLGPGHRWPLLLMPLQRLLAHLPATADAARRLAPVRLPQMIVALARAIERPPARVRVLEVAQIARAV